MTTCRHCQRELTAREYRVTFGLKYAREAHPVAAWAHPAGWLAVIAPDEETARALTVALVGLHWSYIYPADEIGPEHFPRGELARVGFSVGASDAS